MWLGWPEQPAKGPLKLSRYKMSVDLSRIRFRITDDGTWVFDPPENP
jgi:hypothetical protein